MEQRHSPLHMDKMSGRRGTDEDGAGEEASPVKAEQRIISYKKGGGKAFDINFYAAVRYYCYEKKNSSDHGASLIGSALSILREQCNHIERAPGPARYLLRIS